MLRELFSEIYIPPSVLNEITELGNFNYDIPSMEQIGWIHVKEPENSKLSNQLEETLHKGEAEAIALAKELNADYILIDEKKGRKVAESQGLTVIGLIGLLIKAKERRLIPKIKPFLDELIQKNFRISTKLYEIILKKVGEN